MAVVPVINFSGECEAAIHYYEWVFDAKVDFIMRYSQADPADWKMPLTDAQKSYVYHAEMSICGQRFMFSDIVEFGLTKGNSFFAAVLFDSADAVRRAYERMREGSTLLVPLKSTTYSPAIANLVDKFGQRWGLMTERT
jgi:PhnB protein